MTKFDFYWGNVPGECCLPSSGSDKIRGISKLFLFLLAPPSAPRSVNTKNISSSWAMIVWLAPAENGTDDEISYSVNMYCGSCIQQNSLFTTDNLFWNLTNLNTYTIYNITVYSKNNITDAISPPNVDLRFFSKVNFRSMPGCKYQFMNINLFTSLINSLMRLMGNKIIADVKINILR